MNHRTFASRFSAVRSLAQGSGLKRSLAVLLLPILPLGAQAQTAITAGSQALLAGWDFDNILASNLPSSPVRPRYSDVYGNNNSSTALTAPGGIYFNGSFGSDNWGAVAKNASGDIDRNILTRNGTGSTFDLGGQTGGEGAADFSSANVGVTFDEFSINLHTRDAVNSFGDLSLLLYGRDIDTTAATTAGVTINWFYSVDGGVTKVATGMSSVFDTNVFTLSTVDFSAITALDGLTDVYLIGQVVESGAAARLNLDNIGAYAFAQEVAAFTFWKGGDGVWTLASSPANWTVDGTGPGAGAWTANVATFRGAPGTVTVDNTAGAVVFKGAKFEVGGYTVAGAALVTNTAASPLQVGDGTAASAAMTATISAAITGTGGIEKTDLGTLVLSGENTYSGGTTVTAGTLSIGDGGTTGSIASNITNNAAVAFNRSEATAYAFAISGTGVVNKLGAGTLSLTGENTYAGGTTVGGGTLSLGDGGTTGSVTGNIVNNAAVAFNRSDAVAYTGVISGTGAVVKQGAGTTTFTGAHTYTGGTTVSAGTLALGDGGTSGGITGNILNNASVVVNRSNALTLTGDISGTGALTQQGAGTTTLTGANTYTGGTTVGAGALSIGDGGTSGSVAGNIANNAAVIFNRSDASAYTGVISGTGTVVKSGAGSLTLSGAHTYTGATTVGAGTLRVDGNQLAATGAVTVAEGATLAGGGTLGGIVTVQNGGALAGATGATLTFGSLVLNETSSLNVALGAPTTSPVFQVNGDLTLDGRLNLSSSAGFGNGLYRLMNYTGALTNNTLMIASGPSTLSDFSIQTSVANQVNVITNLSSLIWSGGAGTWATGAGGWQSVSGSAVNWNPQFAIFQAPGAAVTVDDAGGPVVFTGLQFAANGYTVVGDALTTNTASTSLIVGAGDPATDAAMTATIAATLTGTGGVNKQGAGTLFLTGANNYSGGTTVSAGTLSLGAGGTGGSLTGDIANHATVAFNRSDAVTYAGVISGSGAVVKQGGGTTTLTGANTYTGGTTVSAGTLSLGDGGTGGSVAGNIINNATLALNRSDVFTLAGSISGTGAVVKQGTGTAMLAGENTHTGGTTVNAGTLSIGAGGTSGSVAGNIANNATAAFNRSDAVTYAGVISGTGSVAQQGAGTTSLTGANTYTGGTTVSAGTLSLGNGGTSGSVAGDITNNATLAFNRSDAVTFAGNVSGSGAVVKQGGGVTTLTGASTHSGGTTVSAGTLSLGDGGTSGSVAGDIALANAATLALNRSDAVTLAGAISGAGGVVKLGAGTTTLTGANTYTGGTTVSAGTLSLGNGGASGSVAGNIANSATVAFNRSDAATYAGVISGTGAVVQQGAGSTSLTGANTYTGGTTVSAGTLSLGAGGTSGSVAGNITNNATLAFNRSDAVTFAGVISGTGGVTKLGAGTTTLTGANTYAGTTAVGAGRLLINGDHSAATGAITVATGGSLGGTGTTGGVVTVQNGGTLVGTAGSVFTASGLTLNATSNVDVTLGAPSTSALFQVNGAFTLDGVLNITGGTGYGDGLYRLFNYTGALTNNTMTVGTAPGGAAGYTIQTATANQVSVIASNTAVVTPWTGGTGTWSSATTGTGWGATNGRWQTGFALFQGAPGTVTVASTTAAPVVVTGVQFAVDEYTVAGTALTTNTANTPFRVGDGTADGAAITATVTAPITGTGGIDKTDLGTLVLGGTNTHTGGTRVTNGVLQVSADTALGASSGALRLNGGTLRAGANLTSARAITVSATGSAVDTGANNVTFSGVISGSGSLTKTGGGMLTVSGANNTNTGNTTIAQGAVMLAASSLGSTTVNAGARLAGTGTVRGNLTNSGTVSPGASPGTLNIVGNYTQSATGTYAVELASATSFDRIVATGSASLAGTLTVTGLGGFAPTAGQSFRILEAAGGVTGTFTTVINPFAQNSAMTRFQTFYNPTNVTLAFLQLPYAGLSGSANQQAVGAAVDAALADGTIPDLIARLNALPTEAGVRTALAQLSPQRYERWHNQAVYSSEALVRTAESRLAEKPSEPSGGLWFELVRRQSKFNAVEESAAAEATANGIVVGGDIPAGGNFKAGLLFAYTDEGLELDTAGSSSSIERFTAATYVRYEATRSFIEAVVGASYTRMDNHRTVPVAGGGLAEGTTDGRDTFASLRTGFLLPAGPVRFTPYLAMQYTGFAANEFTEAGAGDASLTVGEQQSDSLSSRVGLLTAVPLKGKSVTFTPRLDLAWRFEFRDELRELSAELGGNEFTVQTGVPETSGLIAGLGLDATFGSGTTAYARLSTERTTAADKAFEARAGLDFRF